MRRTIRVFGVAALAALAVSAFGASAAWAGHTWEVDGVLLKAGESRECKATTDGTLTLHAVTATGVTFHLTSTTFTTTNCKISQVGSGATAEAVGSIEKISFGGITIDAPIGCKVTSPISTNPISSHLVTVVHKGVNTAFITFNPTASTNGTWANITLKECAAAETYPLKGQVCAEMDQAGQLTKEQTVKFSATADEACSSDKLTFGGGGGAILRGGVIIDVGASTWGWTAT